MLDHLADRLFTPARLTVILEASIARSDTADADRAKRLAQGRCALMESQGRVSRLLKMIETGLIGLDDPQLRERMEAAKFSRRQAEGEVRVLEAAGRGAAMAITPEAVERLSGALRGALAAEDPAFRKAYLRFFVSEIVVDDEEVRMTGPTSNAGQGRDAGQASSLRRAGAQFCLGMASPAGEIADTPPTC